jgi:hypothetical protein
MFGHQIKIMIELADEVINFAVFDLDDERIREF